MESPRPLSLVKFHNKIEVQEHVSEYPFHNDMPLLFLGEIPNMPEHGVFIGFRSGKVYSGYHIWNFVELSPDEV